MGRVEEWVLTLQGFSAWMIGGSATQLTARQAEDFVQTSTQSVFPDAWIIRMGTQQHPDFLVGSKSWEAPLRADSRLSPDDRVSKSIIERWEAAKLTARRERFLRLEVKTGKTVYTLNDTFPNPQPDFDEVYVLFLLSVREIWVTTSASMAEEFVTNPPIGDRYIESKAAVKSFDSQLKTIWDGTPVGTAARPTYRVGPEYAHRAPKAGVLESLFTHAGLPD